MSDVPRGQFVWFDLMTTDPDAAKSFYPDLIGWTVTADEMEGYAMWKANDTLLGGVMELPEDARKAGAPPHWLGYIATPDVDETVAKATELGGTLLVPGQDLPTVGRFAVLTDPSGAVFAVYKSESDWIGHDGPARDGDVSWCELMTADLDEAFDFYSRLFGWAKTEAMEMGEAGTYQMFGRGNGETMGGMMKKPAEVPVSSWTFYFQVPDADAGGEKAKSLGGQVVFGPMDVPGDSGDRIVMCQDPQGAMFAMHARAAG